MYIINKFDHKTSDILTIGYDEKSVWDAKGLAVRFIRLFITDNDGEKNLHDAFNFDISTIKDDEVVKRHHFCLNLEQGTFEVYKLVANPTYSMIWGYTNNITNELIFSLSISKIGSKLFNSTSIKFKENDIAIANNTIGTKEEQQDIMHQSLVSELKFFIKEKSVDEIIKKDKILKNNNQKEASN